MKIFTISDLHLSTTTNKPMDIFGTQWDNYWEKIVQDWTEKVTDEDIVLLPGDLSWAMNLEDAKGDIAQVANLKGKKIIIKGNHDYWWQSISKVREILPTNFYAIQNNCMRFDKFLISGTRLWTFAGQTPDDVRVFEREYVRAKLCLQDLASQRKDGDIAIFMCHFPPFDVSLRENKFTALFEEFGINTVIYGHLHGKDSRVVLQFEKNKIKYYLASCDLVDNKLIQLY